MIKELLKEILLAIQRANVAEYKEDLLQVYEVHYDNTSVYK